MVQKILATGNLNMIFKIISKILLQQNINELSQNSKTSIYSVSQARTITRFKSFIDGN